MPKYYDITPSEFIHDYLNMDYLDFVRIGNTVYLIHRYQVLEYENYGFSNASEGIYDIYDIETFSQDFGLPTSQGFQACLTKFKDNLVDIISIGQFMNCLEDDFGATIPDRMPTYTLRRQFFSACKYWYFNLARFNFFDSDKLKTLCEIAKDGAIFANESVPYASEEILIALEEAEYWEEGNG